MKIKPFFLLLFTLFFFEIGTAQDKPWSVRMAESFMDTHKDSILVGANKFSRWDYEQGLVLMATAKYGKGTVFVVGDPWIYNEYVNGKRLPAQYENFQAARLLAKWLLEQSK